jgi:16S rRNA processing protein RimM
MRMTSKKSTPSGLLLMAEIAGAHGVKGAVKMKAFGDDPEALADYPPLSDAKGEKQFIIKAVTQHSSIWIAEIEGVNDRTAAEKLFGTQLYLSRADLPKLKKKNAYYHADLIGMTALLKDGGTLGTVIAVANFGAGDLLDIKPSKGGSFYVPFTNAVVPDVDLAAKTLTVDPPPGLLD